MSDEILSVLEEEFVVTSGPRREGSSMIWEMVDDGSPREVILARRELLLEVVQIREKSPRGAANIHDRSSYCQRKCAAEKSYKLGKDLTFNNQSLLEKRIMMTYISDSRDNGHVLPRDTGLRSNSRCLKSLTGPTPR